MPRRVVFHRESAGDPQTVLEDDKDPMLTLNPDYLDCRADADPDGDLGKDSRGPRTSGWFTMMAEDNDVNDTEIPIFVHDYSLV